MIVVRKKLLEFKHVVLWLEIERVSKKIEKLFETRLEGFSTSVNRISEVLWKGLGPGYGSVVYETRKSDALEHAWNYVSIAPGSSFSA